MDIGADLCLNPLMKSQILIDVLEAISGCKTKRDYSYRDAGSEGVGKREGVRGKQGESEE